MLGSNIYLAVATILVIVMVGTPGRAPAAPSMIAPSVLSPVPAPVDTSSVGASGTSQTLIIRVPLTPMPGHGSFLIHLRLDGTTDATFIIDTGTEYCAISQSMVKQLGLKTTAAMDRNGNPTTLSGKQATMVALSSLEFIGATISGKTPSFVGNMIVLPDNKLVFSGNTGQPDNHLDGIIGAPFLDNFACGFDFSANTVTFYWPGKFSVEQAEQAGYALPAFAPLTLSRGSTDATLAAYDQFNVKAQVVNGTVSRQVSLMVDIGSDTTIIPCQLAKGLSLQKIGQERQYGLTRDFQADEARVTSLDLGNISVPDAEVLYPDTGGYPPVLGMDILSGYNVLMDFPGEQMFMAPAPPPFAPTRTPEAASPPAPAAKSMPVSPAGK